jgi:hypothetical protein
MRSVISERVEQIISCFPTQAELGWGTHFSCGYPNFHGKSAMDRNEQLQVIPLPLVGRNYSAWEWLRFLQAEVSLQADQVHVGGN